MVSLVGNYLGNFISRLDIYDPIPLSISLPLIVPISFLDFSKEEEAVWEANLAEAFNG